MAIHQELDFACSGSTLFRALTDGGEFSAWAGAPAEFDLEAGGAFHAFGGRIEGRTLECEEDQRLVQAWRAADWPEGVYSIVRIRLDSDGDRTRLTLDQAGHPEEAEPHLDGGWHKMYWEPLKAHCE